MTAITAVMLFVIGGCYVLDRTDSWADWWLLMNSHMSLLCSLIVYSLQSVEDTQVTARAQSKVDSQHTGTDLTIILQSMSCVTGTKICHR